jgi:hypothetical protein
MNSDLARVQEKQKKRYQLLRRVYDLADGQVTPIRFFSIAEQEGFNKQDAEDAYHYLIGEGLIESFSATGSVLLTHLGIIEVEHSIMNPNRATEHFATSIIQHFNAPVGAVQNAAYSTANVNQTIGVSSHEVFDLIQQLRHHVEALPTGQRQEAEEFVEGLVVEANSVAPNKTTVKALISALGSTLQDIATDVLAKLAAEMLNPAK